VDRDGPLLVALEEARPAVQRQLAVLQRRLRVAQEDMMALVERLQQEAAVSEFLTQKVRASITGEMLAQTSRGSQAVCLNHGGHQEVGRRPDRVAARYYCSTTVQYSTALCHCAL